MLPTWLNYKQHKINTEHLCHKENKMYKAMIKYSEQQSDTFRNVLNKFENSIRESCMIFLSSK